MTPRFALLLALVTLPATAQAEPVRLGQVGLSFYAVVGGVVQQLLEREDYAVEVVEGPHAEIFPKLGAGEVDVLAAAWLPSGHAELFAPVEDVVFRIAPIYEDAAFFWVVPSYVPEADAASIADLTRPDVREKMPSRIVSLPESTGLTVGARRVMEAYGLGEAGYELVAGPPADWLTTFTDAVAAEEWVVFPLWQPQWVNAAHDVRRLEEPRNAYGDPDTAYLLGHQELRDKLAPETLDMLSNVRFSIADVTEMDRLVNVDGLTPREAAARWMGDNPKAVEGWFATDR